MEGPAMLDQSTETPSHMTVNDSGDITSFAGGERGAYQKHSRPSAAGRLMQTVLRKLGDPAIQVVLWNGETITTSQQPVARVTFSDRATLLKVFVNPQLEFGEGYSAGRISVEGDLTGLMEEVNRREHAASRGAPLRQAIAQWWQHARANTLRRSRAHIHHHYDIGNDFYALWLGETMAYTCAYYPTPAATLDEAQVAKMDHVCRKLRLQPGEKVVEVGCGWGSLALHMARHYGVEVKAFNISREQVAFARARAHAAGLAGRVEFIEDDYRNSSRDAAQSYDVFVSIGMLEHVGVANYRELGRVIDRCLKPSGRGLIHSIGRNRPAPLHPWIAKRIFPGAYPPSLKQMMDIFEATDLSVLDVENLRLHYARTLQGWRAGFEQAATRIADMFDDTFVRMWRLYLAGAEASFTTGDLQLFQVLFAPGTNNNVPWTRADVYQNAAPRGFG
jgi:cyclopropane-fatty-acyl-phospholipid synthase